MRKVTIHYGKMSDTERKRALGELAQPVNVEETMRTLVRHLKRYERKFGLSTVEFYAKFLAGEMGDSFEVIEWASDYEQYVRLTEAYREKAAGQ
jgi:hypothetical protein